MPRVFVERVDVDPDGSCLMASCNYGLESKGVWPVTLMEIGRETEQRFHDMSPDERMVLKAQEGIDGQNLRLAFEGSTWRGPFGMQIISDIRKVRWLDHPLLKTHPPLMNFVPHFPSGQRGGPLRTRQHGRARAPRGPRGVVDHRAQLGRER